MYVYNLYKLSNYVHTYIVVTVIQMNDTVNNNYYEIIYVPLTSAVAGSLGSPTPNLLTAVTVTTTVPVNTPLGSDGAVNVSVVVELLTFIIVPL